MISENLSIIIPRFPFFPNAAPSVPSASSLSLQNVELNLSFKENRAVIPVQMEGLDRPEVLLVADKVHRHLA